MRPGPVGDGTRTLVMGVVNVTPDSFSDGGAWFEPDAAIAHGRRLLAEGADLLDVGGESTRPGAQRPSVSEELRRVLPVVEALAGHRRAARGVPVSGDPVVGEPVASVPVSIDTMRAEVAAAALDAGASIVNDVSGGLADPQMAALVAEREVAFVAMHWRGHSVDMQRLAVYADVVAEVRAELADRVEALLCAGVAPHRLVLDPGLGFAKLAEHNWALLAHLPQLQQLGFPLLVGASRKAFLGKVGRPEPGQRPALERDVATAATSVYAAQAGVWAVRVHDVRATRDALDVVAAMTAATRRS